MTSAVRQGKNLGLKAAWFLGVACGVVLGCYAAYLPDLTANLNDIYWKAHYQPYFWRLLTDGESIALGMGFQALAGTAVYGTLTQAMPRTQPFYQQLRWVLRLGLLLSFLRWPFWVLGLLFF